MKVFLSWSGETSKHVATVLRDWLQNVIQAIDPWISSEDIPKGARWSSKIASELATTNAGIICVTPDNSGAPWLNFEAGALSKSVDKEMVCPYLFKMKPSDLTGPLTEFQLSQANKEDTRRLIGTLNKAATPKPLPDTKLTEAFEMWWPKLEKGLESIPLSVPTTKNSRSPESLLEEVLDIVRDQARESQQFMNEWRRAEIQSAYFRPGYPSLSGLIAPSNIHADSGSGINVIYPYSRINTPVQTFDVGDGVRLDVDGPSHSDEGVQLSDLRSPFNPK